MDKLNEFKSPNFIYDIFGYFLPGFFFICLIIIDFDLGSILKYYTEHGYSLSTLKPNEVVYKMEYLFKFLTWNTDSDFKFTTVFMLLLFCYLIGHIIAAISSQVLEVWINYKLLKFPSENLLKIGKRKWLRKVFKNYTKPFSDEFIMSFKNEFKTRYGEIGDYKSYYWLSFTEVAKENPIAYSRLLHFLNLYGFSRNVSGCFFIYILSRLVISYITPVVINYENWIILFFYALIGAMMFKNYLKLFYRQCTELYYHFYTLRTSKNN